MTEIFPLFRPRLFMVYAPRLPIEKLQVLYQQSGMNLKELVSQILKEDSFITAIKFSSVDLYQKTNELFEKGSKVKNEERVCLSLIKYYLRMTSKPTPFGHLATFSIGEFSNQHKINSNEVKIELSNEVETSIYRNFADLFLEMQAVISDIKFLRSCYVFKNQSINIHRDEFIYYALYDFLSLRKISYSSILNEILKKAENGILFSDLVLFLSKEGHRKEDSEVFIRSMIDKQLLLPEIWPNHFSEKYQDQVKIFFEKRNPSSILLTKATKPESIPHVTLKRAISDCRFSDRLFSNLSPVIKIVKNLTPEKPQLKRYQQFKTYFGEFYGNLPVNLLDIFEDGGIGSYGNLYTERETKEFKPDSFLEESLIKRDLTVDLFEHPNSTEIVESEYSPPPSFTVKGELVKVESHDFFFKGLFGPTCVRDFMRFTHEDALLSESMSEIISRERNLYKGKDLVEMYFIPYPKVGNIVNNKIKDRELLLISPSLPNHQECLRLSDIMVIMKNDCLALYNKHNGKEIVPVLSSLINYANLEDSIINFLGDHQYHVNGDLPVFWDWGPFAKKYEFLPRICYKQTIISPRTWNLLKKDILKEGGLKSTAEIMRLPEFVNLDLVDSKIIINPYSDLGSRLVNDLVKDNIVSFSECYHVLGEAAVRATDGQYANEILIPFCKETNNTTKKSIQLNTTSLRTRVNHNPGSGNWIYFKIYCRKATEKQLLNLLNNQLTNSRIRVKILRWYFVRYLNPSNNLRIRIFVRDGNYFSVLEAITNKLNSFSNDKALINFEICPYQPEYDRYDDRFLRQQEHFFAVTTKLYLDYFIDDITYNSNDKLGGVICLVYGLLSRCGFKDIEILSFANEARETLEQKSIGRKFTASYSACKNIKDIFLDYIELKFLPEKSTITLQGIIENSLNEAQSMIDKFVVLKNDLDFKHKNVIASSIHMTINKMFTENHNYWELIMYDLLAKCVKTKLAKTHKSKSN